MDQGLLNQGQGHSLTAKLQAAQAALDAGDTEVALEHLNAFVNETEAMRSGGTLDPTRPASLIAMATAVIASIAE